MTPGELRRLKRNLKTFRKQAGDNAALALEKKAECIKLAAKVNSLTLEVAEWKRRFDTLLSRTPEVKP